VFSLPPSLSLSSPLPLFSLSSLAPACCPVPCAPSDLHRRAPHAVASSPARASGRNQTRARAPIAGTVAPGARSTCASPLRPLQSRGAEEVAATVLIFDDRSARWKGRLWGRGDRCSTARRDPPPQPPPRLLLVVRG
jgi:hypothetical protein